MKLGDSLEETDGRQPDVSTVLGLKMEKRWWGVPGQADSRRRTWKL